MSDEVGAPALKPTPAIPLESVRQHITDHAADKPCEACGQANWLVFSAPNLRGVSIQVIDDTGFPAAHQIVPLMPVMCQNCGCMRFFAIGSIVTDAFNGSEVNGE